jgi:hypothetical protein
MAHDQYMLALSTPCCLDPLQADVIRAAGLSAAAGDWSEHTQQAVNVISGVQPHTTSTSLYPDTESQQPQQQHQHQQHASIPEHPASQQQQHHQQQQQDTVVLIPERQQASQWTPQLPVSSPPLATGTAAAPSATAAAAAMCSQGVSSGGGHSTDAVALVVARPAEGRCSTRA